MTAAAETVPSGGPSGGPAPAIEAHELGYVYSDGRRAVSRLSLTVAPGEAVGVIGPNGAGKTTLFMLLGGLYPPAEGRLAVFGRPVGSRPDHELRRRIGVVFQSTDEQLFSPTVFDDVAFGPLNFGCPKAEVRERVSRTLRQVGLEGFEGRTPHHLSAGERRRVALATVLAYDPDILILDEPTSDLDPRGRRELVTLLAGMHHARLIASHDLEFIARTCPRVILLENGTIRSDTSTIRTLTDATLLESCGLEVPLGLRGLAPEALERLLRGGG